MCSEKFGTGSIQPERADRVCRNCNAGVAAGDGLAGDICDELADGFQID